MATLLDLAQQGDPATVSDDSQLRDITLMNPQQLYELWERQPWSSQTIDLERDKLDWAGLSEQQREEILWILSSFFIGEERVTTQFSGLVMAYEDEQEEAFLTTQQVDEARHMQFFDRYYREVFAYDGGIEARLARTRELLTPAFLELFDERLVEAGKRLIGDPSDVESKIGFVTTYHMVIEGTLALTGQNFLLDYFESNDLLPGFVEGFTNIARDEHRHVAYGTWFLQQKASEEAHSQRIQDTLVQQLPLAAGVLVPPGRELGDEYEFLGYTSEEQTQFAYTALTRRLKVIGVGLPEVAQA
jgi:ribonucleoside-diphosphate reductase beta chain